MAGTGVHGMAVEELLDVYLRDDDGDGAKKRIQALARRLREANDRADQAEAAAADAAKVAAKETRKAADEEWGAKLSAQQEALALARHGVNDDDTALLLRRSYERTPEQGRPPFADYVGALKVDKKAREALTPAASAALDRVWGADGGAPDLTTGAGRGSTELTEQAIREAFARGQEGISALLVSRGA